MTVLIHDVYTGNMHNHEEEPTCGIKGIFFIKIPLEFLLMMEEKRTESLFQAQEAT